MNRARASGPWAAWLGWWAVAAVNAILIAVTVPWPSGGGLDRLQHHYFDAGQLIALGALTGLAVAGWSRLVARLASGASGRRAALATLATYVAVWLVAIGVGFAWIAPDLAGLARKLGSAEGSDALHALLVVGFALPIPLALRVGRWLARPGLRWVGLAGAVAAAAANHWVLRSGYPGLHLLAVWAAATLAGASAWGARVPGTGWLRRVPQPGVVACGLAALSAVSLVWWPSNAVVLEMYRTPGTVLAPYLAQFRFRDGGGGPIEDETREWYAERSGLPPIPPTEPRLIGDDALVIMVSIDAVRPDVFARAEPGQLANLRRLRAESVRFEMARASGSQTVYTITDLFAGTHFSQQYWSRRGQRKTGELWPWADKTQRFPELLAQAGVRTATFASAWWLVSSVGVVRGFQEERKCRSAVKTDFGFPLARDVMEPALARIERYALEGDRKPLFMYMHFMDPHDPYNRGGEHGSKWKNYIAEIEMVDREIGRLRNLLERTGLWERTVFIALADHGEAFGEHGIRGHAHTLYEELVRVPLLIRVPGVTARAVDEPVSTMDLGPTILDLYGVPTPASIVAQSLVPLLQGRDVQLTRPIIAEGRLMQSIVTRDGYKAIRDLRKGTLEAYHLPSDPEETRNVLGTQGAVDAMNRLRRFFSVHTYHEGGYVVPYRK